MADDQGSANVMPPNPSQIASQLGLGTGSTTIPQVPAAALQTPIPAGGIQLSGSAPADAMLPDVGGTSDMDQAVAKTNALRNAAMKQQADEKRKQGEMSRLQNLQAQTDSVFSQLPAARQEQAKIKADMDTQEAAIRQENIDFHKSIMDEWHRKEKRPLDAPPEYQALSPLEKFGSMASILGIFASGLTRTPLVAALNASGSAMKAAEQGNTEAFNAHYDTWKAKTDETLKLAKEDREALKDVLDLGDKDMSLSIAKLRALGAARGMPSATLIAQVGDLSEAATLDSAIGKAIEGLNSGRGDLAARKEQLEIDKMEHDKANGYKGSRSGGNLTEDAVSEQVGRYLGGDKTAISSAGYSPGDREKILEGIAAARKKGGITPQVQAGIDQVKQEAAFAGMNAEARTVGTRAGALLVSAASVEGSAKLATQASDKIDRTQYPSLNDAEMAVKKGTGDSDVVDFIQKNTALINEYATALNPRGVPRIEDKNIARDNLSTAFSKGQYQRSADAMVVEIRNAQSKTNKARAEMFKSNAATGAPPASLFKGEYLIPREFTDGNTTVKFMLDTDGTVVEAD